LFDFDGTLVDSEPLHYEAWLHAVRDFGATTDWDDYRARFVGQTDRWAGRMLLSSAGHPADDETVSSVCMAKHAYFRAKTPERLTIPETARAFVLEALSHLPLGIVSTSPTVDVEPTVIRAGIRERFEVLVCGEHVSKHKPDPEPYLFALARLNASGRDLEAAEVLVLEDSQSGIAAARAAGMRVRPVTEPGEVVTLVRAELGLA
jgi:HAD superfamily hydrolase (TIGR01509 family)